MIGSDHEPIETLMEQPDGPEYLEMRVDYIRTARRGRRAVIREGPGPYFRAWPHTATLVDEMNPSGTRPYSGYRFWCWYVLAWLNLAALYSVVMIPSADSFAHAAMWSLVYVTPMALLVTAALAVFPRIIDWSAANGVRFVLTHIALGLVFGFGASKMTDLLFEFFGTLDEAHFGAAYFNFEYDHQHSVWEPLVGVLIYFLLAGFSYSLLLRAQATRATSLQTQAELRALRAQLNPHFLFNTLHSLHALVRYDPRAAGDALEQFGDLLRYTLDTQKKGEVVSLGEELDFIDNYLTLEALRLGDRLKLDIEIDDLARDCPVPAFCLQPLVENAIRHAIAPRASGGRLTLRVRQEAGELLLEVADDGAGATAAQIENAEGVGLRLVRERLAAFYGREATLDVYTLPGRGFRVTIRLPADGVRR